MIKFDKIACADHPGLPEWSMNELQNHSKAPITRVKTYPQSNQEIKANIGDADCALVSWNTRIDRELIEQCPNLRYIGMCCSLIDENSANVDIKAARENGIEVKGVRDYGDEGVIEFILSELIRLIKGTGTHQWRKDQEELGGQKIGIVGLGTTGKMLAQAAQFFKMDVYYYSRTRNTELEAQGVKYCNLEDLMQTVDIVSIHLPKNTMLLTEQHFKLFGNGKILINTTLGLSFEKEAYLEWMQQENNFSIMDVAGMGVHAEELAYLPRMVAAPNTSGFTKEAKDRLARKVIQNIESVLLTTKEVTQLA